ncbi:uncharacterized protein LOC143361676 [Halictus rubicundus]|uniref:uncharacterized protein LOC143361676 n=1 Tax=Halictus rubicundus TaxID=77578 RepID=UPI004035DF33
MGGLCVNCSRTHFEGPVYLAHENKTLTGRSRGRWIAGSNVSRLLFAVADVLPAGYTSSSDVNVVETCTQITGLLIGSYRNPMTPLSTDYDTLEQAAPNMH